MVKFFQILIITSFGFFATQAFAGKVIKLSPKESKQLTNNYLWTLNATCSIQTKNDNKNKIRVSILKNKGSVNGKNLTTGQGTSVTVKANDSISVSAEPGTKVNLINLGDEPVQAICA
ncbi:Uncharacterised protein (plasmid) [Legionella adelaidensis]|uniref:Endospore appendages core domain-containing protein n=1 Tax=Legionella adelaidensis TaxID=45056 RepID=A0A0W0R412_9GAMM|nr:S-Ena type endospore appendage [Legionella adelaidensis]KTC65795.1 hypothetical protein Lade_0453 [Legionella adelaidensis]VEH85223.1 Uncharacterised protein [Legionella adelaidensis]